MGVTSWPQVIVNDNYWIKVQKIIILTYSEYCVLHVCSAYVLDVAGRHFPLFLAATHVQTCETMADVLAGQCELTGVED